MTMFSMKPQFDLAEFLAVPATAAASRSRNSKGRNMQFRARPSTEEASSPVASVEAPVTAVKPE